MTTKNILLANSVPYKRYIIEAGDLKEPAKLVPAELALVERYLTVNDPGPYLISTGDVTGYEEALDASGKHASRVTRLLSVNEDGLLNFFQLGSNKVEGKTFSYWEDPNYNKVAEAGGTQNSICLLDILEVSTYRCLNDGKSYIIPYISTPIYMEQILAISEQKETVQIKKSAEIDNKILIFRGDHKSVLSYNS